MNQHSPRSLSQLFQLLCYQVPLNHGKLVTEQVNGSGPSPGKCVGWQFVAPPTEGYPTETQETAMNFMVTAFDLREYLQTLFESRRTQQSLTSSGSATGA